MAYGQEYDLTGVVTDNTKLPLPGVTVTIKGTSQGVETDYDGKFTIRVKPKDVLVFSYIGHRTQEITITNQKTLSVVLEEEEQELHEVVVTGYNRKAKAYSVSSNRRIVMRGVSSTSAVYKPTETYAKTEENKFKKVSTDPISTFSADVDRASYSNVRRFINNGTFPDQDAVRIEEMINYFEYDYPQPQANSNTPLALTVQVRRLCWRCWRVLRSLMGEK